MRPRCLKEARTDMCCICGTLEGRTSSVWLKTRNTPCWISCIQCCHRQLRSDNNYLKIMKRSQAFFSPLDISTVSSPKIISDFLSPSGRSRYFYGAPPLFNSAQRVNYLEAITSPPRSLAYYRKPKNTGALNESISIKRLNVSH